MQNGDGSMLVETSDDFFPTIFVTEEVVDRPTDRPIDKLIEILGSHRQQFGSRIQRAQGAQLEEVYNNAGS
jgi:hypothetical protein